MGRLQKSEAGFGAIQSALLLAVVAIIGFVGWYVYQTRSNSNESYNNAANTSVAASKKASNPATTSDKSTSNQTTAKKYLEIKEWGVKFELTSDIYDAYYDNKVSTNMAAFSLRSHSLDNEPDCTTGSQSVVTIFRVAPNTSDDTIMGQTYEQTAGDLGKQVGKYFYFVGPAQYKCTADSKNDAQLAKVVAAFKQSAMTLQAM